MEVFMLVDGSGRVRTEYNELTNIEVELVYDHNLVQATVVVYLLGQEYILKEINRYVQLVNDRSVSMLTQVQ